MKNPIDKKELLKKLRNYDHSLLTPEGANKFCKGFNIPAPLSYQIFTSDPIGTFKGLTLYDKKGKQLPAGTKRPGIEGNDLATYIAKKLGGNPDTSFHGRGFQHQASCDEIEKFI